MQFHEIQTLLREFDQSASVGKLKIQNGDFTLELEKPSAVAPAVIQAVAAVPAQAPVAAQTVAPVAVAPVPEAAAPVEAAPAGDDWVLSPMVGVFYSAPSPDSAPYIQVGQKVTKGQPLCLLEAMKTMNEIQAEWDGVVEAILISNEQIVEYQQPLIRIRRA